MERLHTLLSDLSNRISDNSAHVARVQSLKGLIDQKLVELSHSISLHDEKSADAARTNEVNYMAVRTMDRIRDVIGTMTVSERDLLQSRQAEVEEDEQRVRLVAIIVGLASFLTRAGVEMYLTRKRMTSP